FPASFQNSSVEDIEFGYRLTQGEKKMFRAKDIMVDHLKKYTLFSMLKTDFKRIVNMIKILKSSKGKNKAGEEAPFCYFANIVLAALILVSLVIILVVNNWWLFSILLLIFIAINNGFMCFLVKRRGFIFALKSIGVLLIEYIVVSISIFWSFLLFLPAFRR
ncbi:hypothetical protein ACFL2J_07970, partial [Candidatus Omnitrophota bacterium]